MEGLTVPLPPLETLQPLLHKRMKVFAEARHERLGVHLQAVC